MISTFAICYTIAIGNGKTSYPWLFLSSSIRDPPESNIGTVGLTLASICLPPIALARYVHILEFHPNSKLNQAALVMAFLVTLATFGVGAFPVTQVYEVHMFFACLAFCNLTGMIISHVYLDKHFPDSSTETGRRFRRWVGPLLLVILIAMGLIFWKGLNFDFHTGHEELVFLLAFLEVSLVLGGLSVFVTFLPDLEDFSLQISVRRRRSNADIAQCSMSSTFQSSENESLMR